MKQSDSFYKFTTIILLVILILIAGFNGFSKISEYKAKKANETFIAAYNQGVSDSLTVLYQTTQNCNVASVSIGNLTRRVADVECIEKITR